MSVKAVPHEFNPDIRSPSYIIRKGLYKAVQKTPATLKAD